MIKESLQEDWRLRVAEVSSAVESLLNSYPPLILEAWISMRGWYNEAVDRPTPPSIVAISAKTADSLELYRYVP